ncbi:hypothetical protein [Alteromonas facilis]|uniref:hypothetical protein n=1 Tax=Alteromonas facilis TaxID=2048004 RepID=UPI000C28AD6B|nr:hypothetical protein [Alteromonas facilis]
MKKVQKIFNLWTKRLTHAHKHCAFTDLIHFKNSLWCCFREASTHVSGDGYVVILQLDNEGLIVSRYKIKQPNTDLRDPKLSISPCGKLVLLAYARFSNSDNRTIRTQNQVWWSPNGLSWSSAINLGMNGWWLWRIRWAQSQQSQAYGLAYNRRANQIDLYHGNPLRYMQKVKSGVLSLSRHDKGYPNESDIHLDKKGKMWALVRRDADTFSAQLGFANPPYTQWQWQDLTYYVGGPAWITWRDSMIVAGRAWTGKHMVTRVWQLDRNNAKLIPLIDLPSAGDNSYPGLSIENDNLYVSYYSSHQDACSEIYLACMSLN